MKCIYCGCSDSKVLDSRSTDEDNAIRRRRECLNCGKRWTTYEIVEIVSLLVVKSDGARQPFSREKIKKGIIKACEKRPVSMAQIDEMVMNIEKKLQSKFSTEVTSKEIGALVMDELKKTDEVAYVRFAAVYRRFKDIDTFVDFLNKIN